MNDVLQTIGKLGVVPVIAIEREEDAFPLGQSLLDGGLPCAEITFRTPAAEKSISILAEKLPDILTGAGTVLSIEQAKKAVHAGARFIVSPGFNPGVVDWCLKNNIVVFPGTITPSEIMMAIDKGLSILKYFPANIYGGIDGLKSISAAFTGVQFIPTGGINRSNLSDYLSLPMVYACGGSWLVKKQLISEGHFDRITTLTKEAVTIAQKTRSQEGISL